MNNGIANCNIVYASPAGCIVPRPSYKWAMLLADLGESRAPVRFLNLNWGPTTECYATGNNGILL